MMTQDIIRKHLAGKRKGEFLTWLNEGLSTPVSTRTLFYWLSGKTAKPNPRVLNDIMTAYPTDDPRHLLAAELKGVCLQ